MVHFNANGLDCHCQCLINSFSTLMDKTPVEEWHFASKNQLPGFYISGTLVENGSK